MSRSRRPTLALAALLLPAVLVACGGSIPGFGGSPPAPVSETPADPDLTPVPNGSDAAGGSAPPAAAVSQTDTDWGRIWDALPAAFPRFPGSVPTETGEFGPVSAEFAVPDETGPVTAWLQATLEGAGYSTEALSGPLEDGSRVIDSVADGGCRIQTVVLPLGGTTHVVVRFGAACPFE